jgi:hypothetical protein
VRKIRLLQHWFSFTQQQAAPFWTGFSFDNSSNSRVSILIMAIVVSLQKELCRRFLPILTTKAFPPASATKATPKPKKGDPFLKPRGLICSLSNR